MRPPTDMLQAGGGDALVWLVLAAVWGIIQFIGSRAKAKQPRPNSRPAHRDDVPEPLQQFLDSLSGAPSAPRPDFRIVTPPEIRAAPRRTAHRRKETHPPPPPPAPPSMGTIPEPASPPVEDVLATANHFRQAQRRELVLPKVMSAQRSMRLPMIIKLSGLDRNSRNAPVSRPALNRKADLKRAVLARVILGPPRAMTDPGSFLPLTPPPAAPKSRG